MVGFSFSDRQKLLFRFFSAKPSKTPDLIASRRR
uniref:Uncharacterized protein n=1 Tax=Nelumbo nucifera TaxID=4432 RepID=A0A822Z426_NELNU|nr:TPA_asm: hypothetical protein HUJ06_008830 [Nelumbo nucifera]